MKHLSLIMFPAFSFWLIFLLFVFKLCPNTTASTFGNQTDHLTLLKFKESISNDPFEILASWNASTHFCNWHGITCNPLHQRVTNLNLSRYDLHGSLSPHVGNLSFLKSLDLGTNGFSGNIPQELGRLSQLQQLTLANNSFTGEIPTNLTSCFNLKGLDLYGNNLIGKIPFQIGSLQNLQLLNLRRNKLSGDLLPLVNLSSLTILYVIENNLVGGIPQEICLLQSLQKLAVSINKLSGTVPSCVYNMSSLTLISAVANDLVGSLPPNMFHTFPNLKRLAIGMNKISGPIPTSIANTSSLAYFDISSNQFVGQVPNLGKLQHLWRLNLGYNNLGRNSITDLEFVKSLTNCSKLSIFSISHNNFGGNLPNFIGNLSDKVSGLYLNHNHISGKIPAELGNLIDLTILNLRYNNFEGIIPTSFGKLQKLQLLDLSSNKLSGDIPPFIGNLSHLYYLRMAENMLEGNIPSSIGNCQKLQHINISQNNLSGTIPLEIFSISSLSDLLDLSQNSLSGSLPKEVGMLKHIGRLVIYDNKLSHGIPETLGKCLSLEYLDLKWNSFNGTIPSSLSSLKGIHYLDLSRNWLYGTIPHALQNLSFLEHLNVSFNILDGEVPTKGVFGNASRLWVTGNKKLCGGITELHLPPCSIKSMKPTKQHKIKLIVVIVCVVVFLLILAFITIYYKEKRNKEPSSNSPTIDQLTKVSYQDLHQGTNGFSKRNLIGSGSFGSVYKGNLVSEDKIVAIKVLNLQKKGAHKSFLAECNALKIIRHRNLVKILTCCSGTDYKDQEFKALVFDYMKNGSLEEWMHPGTTSAELHRTINLSQRLDIIIDVASALHYLHHECEQVVIHCDLKPSNVLLDDDMVAHVSDFGISRLVLALGSTSQKETNSTVGVKGTIGYAPPEYGMGYEVSTYGDMYSFGILILEILTGRRPTDEMLEDGQNLRMFVEIAFPDNVLHILDPNLAQMDEAAAIEDGNIRNLIPTVTAEKCLISLFRIGLACSLESPNQRMNIVDVIKELNMIKKAFLTGIRTRG